MMRTNIDIIAAALQ